MKNLTMECEGLDEGSFLEQSQRSSGTKLEYCTDGNVSDLAELNFQVSGALDEIKQMDTAHNLHGMSTNGDAVDRDRVIADMETCLHFRDQKISHLVDVAR